MTYGGRRADGRRLNQVLASAGIGSRRSVDDLIKAGRVVINGSVASIGSRVSPGDDVQVNGRQVAVEPGKLTLILNKPAGVVTTVSDTHRRRTVMDLVERAPGLVPVGRLDLDSRGLLLLSNDGELIHRLTHPRHGVVKIYRVVLSGKALGKKAAADLARGVTLDDGPAKPVSVRLTGSPGTFDIEMTEGRKREVRRICAASGYDVVDLCRVAFGPIRLGALAEGQWRPLRTAETRSLYACVDLDPPMTPMGGSDDR